MYQETNIVAAGATLIFGGNPIGWTEDATVLGYDIEILTLNKVQQKAGTVGLRRIGDKLTIKCNIIENTLENVKLALGINAAITMDTGNTKRTLQGDQSGDLPSGSLLIYGKGPGGVLRTFVFHKAILTNMGEIGFDAKDRTKIALTFEIVFDPLQTYRFYIDEEYAPTAG